jgi:hypothetical protein
LLVDGGNRNGNRVRFSADSSPAHTSPDLADMTTLAEHKHNRTRSAPVNSAFKTYKYDNTGQGKTKCSDENQDADAE